MILFGFMFIGGCIGLWAHHYFSNFAQNIAQEVYTAYTDIYPQKGSPLICEQAGLKPIKCGHFLRYFFSFAVFFGSCFYAFTSLALAAVFALYASLLCIISVIDWHYKLISPAMCQFLLSSGIIAAYGEITSISLEQSLQSALFGFTAFFIIYHLSKLYYRQEALGRGDYWLVAGLAAFIPWQILPLMILIACLSALSYGLWLKYHKREIGCIPFAPFLTIGGIFTFLLNNASIV